MESRNAHIDPVDYGVLIQKVRDMDGRIERIERDFDKRIDKMDSQLDQLLEIANKGRGGLLFGLSITAAASSLIGQILKHFKP